MVSMCAVVEKCMHAIAWRLKVFSSHNHICMHCCAAQDSKIRPCGGQDRACLQQSVHCRTLGSVLAVERTVRVCRALTASTL